MKSFYLWSPHPIRSAKWRIDLSSVSSPSGAKCYIYVAQFSLIQNKEPFLCIRLENAHEIAFLHHSISWLDRQSSFILRSVRCQMVHLCSPSFANSRTNIELKLIAFQCGCRNDTVHYAVGFCACICRYLSLCLCLSALVLCSRPLMWHANKTNNMRACVHRDRQATRRTYMQTYLQSDTRNI